ncbi:MAG: hypothetical protein H0X39_07750 [Actinobacteria bacterium]|nr:hypothetical protein [Actinomycetota bacterium]
MRRNRVTPLSELVAVPERGLLYGNRGCLHDQHGQIKRRFNGKRWIACRLEFKGWRRGALLQPGKFTELFLLDEVTAFAAGHRPCALCRSDDYKRFSALWRTLHPGARGAEEIDAQLHLERVDPTDRGQLHHPAPLSGLPDGTFVLHRNVPALVQGDRLLGWSPGGYGEPQARPRRGTVAVITPPSLVEVLRAGWEPDVPLVHPSAHPRERSKIARATDDPDPSRA